MNLSLWKVLKSILKNTNMLSAMEYFIWGRVKEIRECFAAVLETFYLKDEHSAWKKNQF